MFSQKMSQLAVCSWSGWPDSPETLIGRLEKIGLRRIQLAFDPLIDKPAWKNTPTLLRDAGIKVVSGMFGTALEDYSTPATIRETGGLGPDAAYEIILKRIPQYCALLDTFGLDKISFHAGFIPHAHGAARAKMTQRLGRIADLFDDHGKQLLLETGQETAETLETLLDELARPNLKVNFDPGNMLLYGMGNPSLALQILMPRVAQLHVKDAIPSGDPEVWGEEKPAGEGCVDWLRIFGILSEARFTGNLVIERECGDDPAGEIRRATNFLSKLLKP